jgi:2-(1,2-epoxy-1,2-dihydrophenyl)acetyl-CoA isomerase
MPESLQSGMEFIDIVSSLDADHVGTIEIQRPPNNFFTTALIGALADACDALAARGCRAVVLCAAGRHFCAGADFASKAEPAVPHLYDMAVRLFAQPLPMVAAVQGSAVGGGLGLAMAADFRVASTESRFTANFSRLGFHHGFGLSVTLPRVVGQQAAHELLLTGRRIDGAEALRMGLCDRLVSSEEIRPTSYALAREIAGAAPLAVRSIRATMRRPLLDELQAALDHEKVEQERLRKTSDFREGIKASRERREPNFTGNEPVLGGRA